MRPQKDKPTSGFVASLQENLRQEEEKKKPARAKKVDSELQKRGYMEEVALPAEGALSAIRQEIQVHVSEEIVPVAVEAQEAETQEVEAQEVDAQEVDAQEVETQEAETQEVEAQEVDAQEVETQEVEAQEVEAQEVEAQEVEAQEVEAQEVEAQEVEAQEAEATEASAPSGSDNLQNKMRLLLNNTTQFVKDYKSKCDETKTGFAARMPYNVARLNAADFIQRLSHAFALQVGIPDEFSSDVVVKALEAGFLIELKKLVDDFDRYNVGYTHYFFPATSLDQTVLSSMLCNRLNMTEKEYRALDQHVLVAYASCLDDCLRRMIAANRWTEDAYTIEIRQRINDIRSGSELVVEGVAVSM